MTDERTEIRIKLPLPLDVAGALTTAIGTMWPDAKIRASDDLLLLVPNRKPKRTSQRTLRDILAANLSDDNDPEAHLAGWDEHGPKITLDNADEAWQQLAAWAFMVLTSSAAPNHVKQEVTAALPDGTRRTFAITCAWSPAQLPKEAL